MCAFFVPQFRLGLQPPDHLITIAQQRNSSESVEVVGF